MIIYNSGKPFTCFECSLVSRIPWVAYEPESCYTQPHIRTFLSLSVISVAVWRRQYITDRQTQHGGFGGGDNVWWGKVCPRNSASLCLGFKTCLGWTDGKWPTKTHCRCVWLFNSHQVAFDPNTLWDSCQCRSRSGWIHFCSTKDMSMRRQAFRVVSSMSWWSFCTCDPIAQSTVKPTCSQIVCFFAPFDLLTIKNFLSAFLLHPFTCSSSFKYSDSF